MDGPSADELDSRIKQFIPSVAYPRFAAFDSRRPQFSHDLAKGQRGVILDHLQGRRILSVSVGRSLLHHGGPMTPIHERHAAIRTVGSHFK